MGDAAPQSSLKSFVLYLDENHCRNPHLIRVLQVAGIPWESHLNHFRPGTPDVEWLPTVGRKNWCLLTTDKRMRRRPLEREAIQSYSVRMFYFANNDAAGAIMAATLTLALPRMRLLAAQQPAPFIASINKSGQVKLRESF